MAKEESFKFSSCRMHFPSSAIFLSAMDMGLGFAGVKGGEKRNNQPIIFVGWLVKLRDIEMRCGLQLQLSKIRV